MDDSRRRKIAVSFERLLGFWWLLPLVAIPVSAWVHSLADLSFPVLWSDEAYFIWPAKAFAETGSLETPSLNPERAIWMHPPGYKAFLAALFLLLEPGIVSARWSSWALITLTYLVLLRSFSPKTNSIAVPGILTMFYLGQHAVIAGNVARPEALLAALHGVAFYSLQRRHFWNCMAILGMATIVHPISLLVAGSAIVVQARVGGATIPKPRPSEWLFLGLAVLFATWAMFAFLENPSAHLADLMVSVRFLHLSWEERFHNLITIRQLVPTIIFCVLTINALRHNFPSMPMVVMALGYWFIHILRPEMWYSIYTALAYAILSAQFLIEADRVVPRTTVFRHCFCPLLLLPVMVLWYLQGFGIDPRHYPYYMWWRHMTIRDHPRYHQTSDEEAVLAVLQTSSARSEPALVRFYPPSEGVLYTGRLPASYIPYDPHFTEIPPDMTILRLSVLAYPGINTRVLDKIESLGIDVAQPFYTRDETEQWFHFDGSSP